MKPEVEAAAGHLCGLLAGDAPQARDMLHACLCQSLTNRVATSTWDVSAPEKGSAARALVCHDHDGGEGIDACLLQACKDANISAEKLQPFTLWIDPGCVAVRMGLGPGTALAVNAPNAQLLNSSGSYGTTVTVIWGSLPVAVSNRASPGPALNGIAVPSVSILPSTPQAIQSGGVSTNKAGLKGLGRPIRIVDPNASLHDPALAHGRTSSTSSNNSISSFDGSESLAGAAFTARSFSQASSAGSSSATSVETGMDRLHSKDASYHDGSLFERDSEATFHSRAKECGVNGLIDAGLDDETITAMQDVDETLKGVPRSDSTDSMDFKFPKGDCSTSVRRQVAKKTSGSVTSSTPSESPSSGGHKKQSPSGSSLNYTTHDNGNVGVLGGGVRLGGSSKPSSPVKNTSAPTRATVAQLLQKHPSLQQQEWAPRSAPTRTVGLPPSRAAGVPLPTPNAVYQHHSHSQSLSYLHQYQYPQAPYHAPGQSNQHALRQDAPSFHPQASHHYQINHPPYPSQQLQQPPPQSYDTPQHGNLQQLPEVQQRGYAGHQQYYSGVEGLSAPPPFGAPSHNAFPSHPPFASPHHGLHHLGMYGGMVNTPSTTCGSITSSAPSSSHFGFLSLDPNGMPFPHMKRVRSRGRRSRGRGAGRAARRQAAAMKAFNDLAEQDGAHGLVPLYCSTETLDMSSDEGEDNEDFEDEDEAQECVLGLRFDELSLAPRRADDAEDVMAVVRARAAAVDSNIQRKTKPQGTTGPSDAEVMSIVRERAQAVAHGIASRSREASLNCKHDAAPWDTHLRTLTATPRP
ncbi:B-CELL TRANSLOCATION GENE [Ceraceosorus bombacis]|uniref:B-CELL TRANSLOCATION protein n=1 Tax=Ceraceosorus bombacis TaxID=401625 RepID=A0A0P1BP31_9BASI|nr:B-CELL TRANSLOCATION GENE [Ceraceosorus bombacis]